MIGLMALVGRYWIAWLIVASSAESADPIASESPTDPTADPGSSACPKSGTSHEELLEGAASALLRETP